MNEMTSGPGDTGPGRKVYRDRNLRIVFSVTLMSVMGVASIAPAFPTIIEAFGISPPEIGWLIIAFTLPGVILAPFLGVMADRWGRKKILVPSLFLFAAAGTACAFAPGFAWLIFIRFLQGIGGASLGALYATLIGDLYEGRERATAMGYNAGVLSVGTASYPAVGGALAMFGWRYPFLLPLLAFPVGLFVLFLLKNPEPRSDQTIREYLLGVRRSINAEVLGLFAASVTTFIILYGSFLTYYPLLIGRTFEGTALAIGLVMSSMSAVTALTASQLGNLSEKFSLRNLVRAGFFFYGLALIIIPFVPNVWVLLIPTVLYGMGHGINFPSIQTLLAGLAPMEHRAAFMSVNGMVLRLGQTLGPIVTGFFFSIGGMSGAFFGGASVAALTIAFLSLIPAGKNALD